MNFVFPFRRRIVETRAYHPFAVAIFEDDVYWTDWGSDSIIKCNRFTGKDDVVVINTDVTANALMILHDVTKPKSELLLIFLLLVFLFVDQSTRIKQDAIWCEHENDWLLDGMFS